MRVIFKSFLTDNEFVLGTTSFNCLDKHDVFDKYQEDNEYESECIFKTSIENINQLSIDIKCIANQDQRISEDIKTKLIEFSEFVKSSHGLWATCN